MRFGKLLSESEVLNRLQDSLKTGELVPKSINDGRFLESTSEGVATKTIALTTSFQTFQHKLGRSIQGYLIVFQDAAQTIYANITDDPQNSLKLRASGTVNAKIWVF